MIGYWISFALIALLIPIGIFTFIGWSATKKDPKLTKEQYAKAGARAFYFIFFYWLCDLFYMSCFIDNLVCKYIFGGLIILIIFTNLAGAFSTPKEKNGIEKFGLIQDFVIGIGLTIYLVYIIPVIEARQIVTPIIAAVYGGLITLVGVAWTIKKTEKDKKDEEKNKAKPLFTFNMLDKEPAGNIKKLCVPEDLEIKFKEEVYVEFENSEKSSIQLFKLFHDDSWFELQGNTIMLPNKTCYFSFRCDSPLNIFLVIKDVLDREYYYSIKIVFLYQMMGSGRGFNTFREIKEISKEEMDLAIMEESKHD